MLAVVLASALAATPTPFTLTSGEVTFEISAPLDTIRGVSRGVSGTITLDPDNWTEKPLARVDIDLSSFRTGIDLRDEDLRDQFFEVQKNKTATLTVTALERPSTMKLEKGVTAEAFARATLSLHGVEQEILFPIKVVFDDEMSRTSLGVSAAFVIPLEQFAMKRPQRLIFKLGKDVRVVVRGRLRGPPPPSSSLSPAPPEPPVAPPPPPLVARKAPATEKVAAPAFAWPANTPEGRGERAFVDASIGGAGNAITCANCHSVHDERTGLLDPKTKTLPPSSSLWGVARRANWWRGVGKSAGDASSICGRMFMLRTDNLAPDVEAGLQAWFDRLSRDPLPAHDFGGALLAKSRSLSTSIAALPPGDAKRGAALVQRTCVRCHGKGRLRPELTPGLYNKELVVSLVRGLGGGQQMPAYGVDRLTDSELGDVVAHLADEKQQIFRRKPRSTEPAKN